MTISKTEKPMAAKITAKKPTAKTVVPKKSPTLKTPTTKKTAPKKTAVKKTNKPSPEAIYKMTEVAAYYIAQKNGFAGNASDYWIAAEAQISDLYQ